MSLESVVIGAARVMTLAEGVKGVYALAGDRTPGEPVVLAYPKDIPDSPIVLVAHDRFELDPGSWEKIRHFLNVDLWLSAAEPASAEILAMQIAWRIVAAMRVNVSLGGILDAPGAAGFAAVVGGGPVRPEDVNGKPFVVYPMIVRVTEASPQTYAGGS